MRAYRVPGDDTRDSKGAPLVNLGFIRTRSAGKCVACAGRVSSLIEARAPRRLTLTTQHGAGLSHAFQQVLEQLLIHAVPPSSSGYGQRCQLGPRQGVTKDDQRGFARHRLWDGFRDTWTPQKRRCTGASLHRIENDHYAGRSIAYPQSA